MLASLHQINIICNHAHAHAHVHTFTHNTINQKRTQHIEMNQKKERKKDSRCMDWDKSIKICFHMWWCVRMCFVLCFSLWWKLMQTIHFFPFSSLCTLLLLLLFFFPFLHLNTIFWNSRTLFFFFSILFAPPPLTLVHFSLRSIFSFSEKRKKYELQLFLNKCACASIYTLTFLCSIDFACIHFSCIGKHTHTTHMYTRIGQCNNSTSPNAHHHRQSTCTYTKCHRMLYQNARALIESQMRIQHIVMNTTFREMPIIMHSMQKHDEWSEERKGKERKKTENREKKVMKY